MAAIPTPKSLLLALGLLFSLSQLHSTLAALYKVGDYNGKWGTDNYFQAGDLLSFVDHTKSGPVHQVSREDYKACETEKPIRTYTDDNNVAHLKEQSTYYFISGAKSQCKQGRKLLVVVLQSAPGPASVPTATTAPPPPTPPPTSTAPAPSTPPASAPPASPPAATTPPVATPASPPPASNPSAPPTSASSPTGTSPAGAPTVSGLASPPSPPAGGPAAPSPSGAPLGAVRTWIAAAAGFCSALLLL